MDNCIFCKIVRGEIHSVIEFENDNILAFHDLNAQAPMHLLIIPKIHISTINDLQDIHKNILGEMIFAAKEIAKDKKIADSGYRLVFNCNDAGGQTVYHIHLHLLGGRMFKWPPG
tara:strand:- start:57 stop:401 length:345 start_codon:yes stop_codon:yes gene_type:complete